MVFLIQVFLLLTGVDPAEKKKIHPCGQGALWSNIVMAAEKRHFPGLIFNCCPRLLPILQGAHRIERIEEALGKEARSPVVIYD